MSSVDNRQSSATTGYKRASRPFTLPSYVNELSPVEESPCADDTAAHLQVPSRAKYQTSPRYLTLPSRDSGPLPSEIPPLEEYQPSSRVTSPLIEPTMLPGTTRLLPESNPSPHVTRHLPALQTGMLPSIKIDTKSLRQPVVIPGAGKKSADIVRLPQWQRWVIRTVLAGLIILVALGTLMTVVPADTEGHQTFNPFQSISNLVRSNSNNPSSIAQPDGYDPGSNGSGYTVGNGSGYTAGNGSGNSFPFGQCTYWADSRYHQLTGFYVPWRGNANAWAYAAAASGWIVSSTPHVPSIIVLGGGVQGAGGYGHVAVVERINSDGSVYTSNMNWYSAGGWGRVGYVTFRPGPGVSFVWHP